MDAMTTVLQEKVNREVETRGLEASAAFAGMEQMFNAMSDFITNKPLTFDVLEAEEAKERNLAVPVLANIDGEREVTLYENALRQFAHREGVPVSYLKRLVDGRPWERELAYNILNGHGHNLSRDRFLLRLVDNELRGVLSSRYRRLDSMRLYEAMIGAASRMNAKILSAHNGDVRHYLEIVRPEIIEVPTKNNGTVGIVIGARLRNSDFGRGATELSVYEMQAVCLNGMVTQNILRSVHVGGELPMNIELSQPTIDADTKRTAGVISDAMTQLFSEETIANRMAGIRAASEAEVDMPREIKQLPKIGLTKQETEATENVIMRSNPDDGVYGEPTLWKLAQAVGAVARHAEPTRRRELETAAGSIIGRVDKTVKAELELNLN